MGDIKQYSIAIRQEMAGDRKRVEEVVEAAFRGEEMSDGTEQLLVARLRGSAAFVPDLSLVAEVEGQIVGHVLVTRIVVREGEQAHGSLALAPVSVEPEWQGRGIGGRLIEAAHEVARKMGFGSVVLLGHAGYYPRFGYRKARAYGIQLPFEVPDENCMAVELTPGALDGVSGMVEYPPEFGL